MNLTTTKKMLVPYDIENPDINLKGFIYPNLDNKNFSDFVNLDNGLSSFPHGRIVYIGVEINRRDLFKRIIDSGKKIESVESLIHNLEEFLRQLKTFKVGDVIGIMKKDDEFYLYKIRNKNKKT